MWQITGDHIPGLVYMNPKVMRLADLRSSGKLMPPRRGSENAEEDGHRSEQ